MRLSAVAQLFRRFTLAAILLVLAAGRVLAAYDPLAVPDHFKPATLDLTIHDQHRERDIPVLVYLPVSKAAAPVVLFSHGLGGVINIHGIFTLPKACSGLPRRGELGLKARAAWIRESVNSGLPRPTAWPLTACVVTAPNEWPDMPTCFRSSRPARACPFVPFQRSS